MKTPFHYTLSRGTLRAQSSVSWGATFGRIPGHLLACNTFWPSLCIWAKCAGNSLKGKNPEGKKRPKTSQKKAIFRRRYRRYPEILKKPVKVISSIFSKIFWNIFCEHFFLPRSFQKFLPFAFLPSGSFRMWGGKTGFDLSFCALPCFAVFEDPKLPRCCEKNSTKSHHCHTLFVCAPDTGKNDKSTTILPMNMGKNGTIWHFSVLCFPALGAHCLQMLCLRGVWDARKHPESATPFVLSLLVFRSTVPRNAYFLWQTLNCQIVPVLPSYTPPHPPLPLSESPYHAFGHDCPPHRQATRWTSKKEVRLMNFPASPPDTYSNRRQTWELLAGVEKLAGPNLKETVKQWPCMRTWRLSLSDS